MAEETKNVDTATEVAEELDVKVGDTVPEEEPKPDIPDELAGLPEEIAREAMEEAAKAEPKETEEEPEEPSEAPAENPAPAEKKQDDVLPNQSIPYVRFKQQLDENHKLKEQLKQLQQQTNNQAPMQQPVMAVGNQPLQQTPMRQPVQQAPVITADVTRQIEQAIEAEAMRMTGMSEDTVKSMEFMDENDPRLQTWNTAKNMARASVFSKIQKERERQIEVNRRIIAEHNQNVLEYNKFAQEQMAEPDFENIVAYAKKDYFDKLKPHVQNVIASAYARIERNMGSPQDTVLIEDFFTKAKNEYRSLNGGGSTSKTNEKKVTQKVRQGQAFPRSGEINGAGNDGNVTVDTLARMLETTPFDEIPEEYQRKLLGYED